MGGVWPKDAGVQLAAARERGDIEAVTELRGRLAAVDEITSVLQDQREAARVRLAAVGDADGAGEFAAAATGWQALQGELRTVLNRAFPERPEAVLDNALEAAGGFAAALRQHIAEERAPKRTIAITRN